MNVESLLTRELEIRFIDARNIVTEAKVSLGIHGYPSKRQAIEVREESIKIFRQRPEETQTAMRRLSADLEAIKIPAGSLNSRASDSDGESEDVSSCTSFATDKASLKGRKMSNMVWPMRRR
jgi:hypothetical protein